MILCGTKICSFAVALCLLIPTNCYFGEIDFGKAVRTPEDVDHVYEARGNTVVLLYHTFLDGSEAPTHDTSLITNAEKFEKDILTLIDLGYKPLSLSDLYQNKNDKDSKYFAITFDDGYLSNYEIAYPILKKHNCYGDIFINVDSVPMSHHFSYEQGREMEKSGWVAIHSHFPVHKDVREYSEEDFLSELTRSFDILSANLGERKYKFFAYPYGLYDEKKYQVAKDNGIDLQFIQRRISEKGNFIIRTGVDHYSDISQLVEAAYLN